jgi:hypothetical protein
MCLAQAASVVEGLDEVEDVGVGRGPVGPEAGADLLFQDGPEAFRGGVVEAAPGPAHALPAVQFGYWHAELSGGVCRSSVAVDHTAGFRTAQCGGHVEGVDDEFSAMVVGHRVADDLAGGQVHPGREVEPALGGWDVGDVPDGLRSGAVGGEVPAGPVR